MRTIIITKEDLDSDNKYKPGFIGKWGGYDDVSVIIEEGLGWVVFEKGIYVNGSIVAKAGSGIEAGWGIEAGSGIEAGDGIEAGWGIKAGWGIEAGWGIVSLYSSVKAKLSITINAKCVIAAGVFSIFGAQVVEAEAIEGGNVAYGVVQLRPRENEEKVELLRKADELIAKANELKVEAEKL